MANEDRDKREYELALLVKSEDDVPGVLTLVAQHQGELVAEPRAKKLALAYKIKGHTEAVFASANFRAAGEDAKHLEHDLRTDAHVIRSMILAAPPASERQPAPTGMPSFPLKRGRSMGPRPASPASGAGAAFEPKPAAPRPLSNEALEKKIEEILQ